MNFSEALIFIAVLLIMLIGLTGIFLPILPGVPLILGGAILYGILTGFKEITVNLILVFTGLTVFSLVIDYLANYLGVKKMGGGKAGAMGAILGLILGIFVGVWGIVIFPFLFAVFFELLAGKKETQALKAGTGAFLGFLFGGLVKFILGCIMIGIFIWRVVF